MKIFIWLLFGLFASVNSFNFVDPEQPEVNWGEESANGQSVYVDESNDGGTGIIAYITEADADITFQSQMSSSDAQLIGIHIDKQGDQWIVTGNRIDYESTDTKNFAVTVIDGTDIANSKILSIFIVNIDDESPTLTATNCIMKENTTIDISNSDCEFVVSDPDGFLDTMDFSAIIGTRDEDHLFEFGYKTPPPRTDQSASVFLYLQEGQLLDYETITLYTFRVEPKDGAGHSTIPLSSIPIIVQVEDMPDQPPRWDSSFRSVVSIVENEPTTISVSATDGDVGINNHIRYEVTGGKNFVTIDGSSGLISIASIDRDVDGNDQIDFTVTAIEVEEPTSTLSGDITLIVNDVDDNVAVITVFGTDDERKVDIEVNEGVSEINVDISASDIDMGENAIYTVTLTPPGSTNYLEAFTIIPGRGYETTPLSLTILNPLLLDYENPDWRVISMELTTTGSVNTSMIDSIPITIQLIDINDEYPIFAEEEYSVSVIEGVEIGYEIITIQATDLDAEDIELGVKHELIGTMVNRIMGIGQFTGLITTITDDAFDYEKQQEVSVQIKATDNVGHATTAQLTISVQDLNDENPRMMVASTIEVSENQVDGYILESTITATDEDSNPYLEFSIDWNSSYATKNSRGLDDTPRCVEVTTIRDDANPQAVTAQLTIVETDPGNTPDYEVFDYLNLQLVVTDKNTEKGIGTDSALIVIRIIDINDNAPQFPEGTENDRRVITENAAEGTVIPSPVANDPDLIDVGKVEYWIQGFDEDTPNWFTIDSKSGIISVSLSDGESIDCDYPNPIWNVTYTVTASDTVHNTSINIRIDINDQNDNFPTLDNQEVSINETPNGDYSLNRTVVLELHPEDLDRDEEFRKVVCRIATNTPLEVTERFQVDDNNQIIVDLNEGVNLDREEQTDYTFSLNCYDNPSGQGAGSNPINPPPTVTITLLDINDNAPTITNKELTVDESFAKGATLELNGFDADEPETDNSKISFEEIKQIISYPNENDLNPRENTRQDLFVLSNSEDNKGVLTLNEENLSDLWGHLVLTISLTDFGTPPLTQDVDVTITVAKYNFKEPSFIFPEEGETYYLLPTQSRDSPLKLFDGNEYLNSIEATDNQNNKYPLSFTIVDDSSGYFQLYKLSNTEVELQLNTDNFDSTHAYQLTISVSIDGDRNGNAAFSKNITWSVDFFDQNTDPIFDNHEDDWTCMENDINQSYTVETAHYAKPGINLPVFYVLASTEYSDLFDVDQSTGTLTLKEELDYESVNKYIIIIQSSKNTQINSQAGADSKFYLTINVGDVNDLPPSFDQPEYIDILVTFTAQTSNRITVSASDPDTVSQGHLRYFITNSTGSPDVSGISNPFEIDESSGVITPTFDPKIVKTGFFILEVTVRDESDEDDHKDTCPVTIYAVTEEHVVQFVFSNDLELVQSSKEKIKQVLDDAFEENHYVTTVQDPTQGEAVDGGPRTLSQIFFLSTDNQAPVDKTQIYQRVTDVSFFRTLKNDFASNGLVLENFDSNGEDSDNMEATLKAWLIGVAVVLGSLCMILLIAFILKTRALNQRINKLSNTKFGSQESGLNRTGVSAPTTNKHAIEGSNPVYNNEVDIKEIERKTSIASGDSDLIGVEDDEKFDYNNYQIRSDFE